MCASFKDPRILIGLVIFGLFIWKADVLTALATTPIDSLLFAGAALAFLVVIGVQMLRWNILAAIAGLRGVAATRVWLAGQLMNEVAPIGTGDLLKGWLLHKTSGKPAGHCMAIAFAERAADVGMLCLIAISAVVVLWARADWLLRVLMLLVLPMVAAIAALIFAPKRSLALIARLVPHRGAKSKLLEMAEHFEAGVLTFRRQKRKAVLAAGFTLANWVLQGAVHTLMFAALGWWLQPTMVLQIVAVSWLLTIPAMLPGGLGIREVATTLFFSGLGVPVAIAGLEAMLFRALSLIYLGPLGAAALARLPRAKTLI